ncbi:MAG: hypothetical protein HY393_01175 [Candidatus Diapherotrites archaeon]|nr:hypothetical protein [Candidatus Diapherotrites archaeon]
MPSLDALKFADRYPFSKNAKALLREYAFSLDNVSPETLARAIHWVESALTSSKSDFFRREAERQRLNSSQVFESSLPAFALAKVFVSLLENPLYYDKLARLCADNTFSFLEAEPNKREIVLDFAGELGLDFELLGAHETGSGQWVARIPLSSYVRYPLSHPSLRLSSQRVEKGQVFVSEARMARLESEWVYAKVRESLPVNVEGIPLKYREIALEVLRRVSMGQRRALGLEGLGSVDPACFPPCMEKLFKELSEGKNLAHMARFDVACFMNEIGMPGGQIIQLYAKTPNFNEKVTRYHVEHLSGKRGRKKYSAPSCAKVREHGLCVANCPVKTPLQFYRNEREKKKQLESPEEKPETPGKEAFRPPVAKPLNKNATPNTYS